MPRKRDRAKLLAALAASAFASPAIVVVLCAGPLPRPGASARSGATGPDPSEYIGSAACQRCHETEYASWRRTLHVQMTRPIADALVEGAFGDARPVRFEAYGRSYAMEKRDGRYFVAISHGGGAPETFEVHYTLGARRF